MGGVQVRIGNRVDEYKNAYFEVSQSGALVITVNKPIDDDTEQQQEFAYAPGQWEFAKDTEE